MFEIVVSDFLKRRSNLTPEAHSQLLPPFPIDQKNSLQTITFSLIPRTSSKFKCFSFFFKTVLTLMLFQKCVLCSHPVQPGRIGLDIMLVCTDCKKSHHPRKLPVKIWVSWISIFRVYGDKTPDDSPHTQVQLAVY